MLRLFKTHQIYPIIPLTILSAIMWFVSWHLHFKVLMSNGMPMYDLAYNLLHFGGDKLYALVGFALFTAQALYLNYIINEHEILYKNTWLPAVFYLLLASIFPPFLWFHPLLFVNTILIFAMDKIFGLYKNPSALSLAFDSSFLLGLAALFYAPAVALFILFALGIILLRPFSWRDWFVGVTGFTMPFFFACLYSFLNDRLPEFYNRMFISGINRDLSISRIYTNDYTISAVFIVILFALSIVRLQSNYFKNVTKSRLVQQLLLIFIPIGILMVIVAPDAQLYRFSILAMPLAVYLSYYFISGKKEWIMEVLFTLFLACWVYNYCFA